MLSTKELAKYLNVSKKTIYNYRQRGMPYVKVGGVMRYDKKEVMKWLKEN